MRAGLGKWTGHDLVILEFAMNIGLLLPFFVLLCMLGVLDNFLFKTNILRLAFLRVCKSVKGQ